MQKCVNTTGSWRVQLPINHVHRKCFGSDKSDRALIIPTVAVAAAARSGMKRKGSIATCVSSARGSSSKIHRSIRVLVVSSKQAERLFKLYFLVPRQESLNYECIDSSAGERARRHYLM